MARKTTPMVLLASEEEYVSGQTAEPGVYLDERSGVIVTLHEPTLLPDEVRVMRFPRTYRRFHNRADALQYLATRKRKRTRKAA